jgi:hypothetical protein
VLANRGEKERKKKAKKKKKKVGLDRTSPERGSKSSPELHRGNTN